jgi:uncharacterized protein YjiS (DUF1127 family)
MKTIAFALLAGRSASLGYSLWNAMITRVRRMIANRADLRRLATFDDRMLADMGLTRSEVNSWLIRDHSGY